VKTKKRNTKFTRAGYDTISRTVLRYMTRRQRVTILSKAEVYSDVYGLSSFKGFLYEPSHGVKVAWSVHVVKREYSWSQIAAAPESNIKYNDIEINFGEVWKSTTNQVKDQLYFLGCYHYYRIGLSTYK
jgi:hypothetical protein